MLGGWARPILLFANLNLPGPLLRGPHLNLLQIILLHIRAPRKENLARNSAHPGVLQELQNCGRCPYISEEEAS